MATKSKWTEKEKRLFAAANDGNKKAQMKIIDGNLFERWLQWNHDLCVSMGFLNLAVDWNLRPSHPKFRRLKAAYFKAAREPRQELADNLVRLLAGEAQQ